MDTGRKRQADGGRKGGGEREREEISRRYTPYPVDVGVRGYENRLQRNTR